MDAVHDDMALSDVLRRVGVMTDRVAQVGDHEAKRAAVAMFGELTRQLDLLLADPSAAGGPAGGVWPKWLQETWDGVEDYFDGALIGEDDDLERAQRASDAAGLPAISVSPGQGKFLALLATCAGAVSILEIGTLGGYSTIWLARALRAGGRLTSLEIDRRYAEVARINLANAGLADRVHIVVGAALESLKALHATGAAPFDVVFIDADKESNVDYFTWAMRLTRPGSLIAVDNVVRHGHSRTDRRIQKATTAC